MRSREEWTEIFESEAMNLGFLDGYKILYCPWHRLGNADTVFLSLNPGTAPTGADANVTSDERGNSYEVERHITKSPITAQFLEMAVRLGKSPIDILTGVVAPFRGKKWKAHTLEQRRANLQLGRTFWKEAFAAKRPTTIIVCSTEATQIATNLVNAHFEVKLATGWGNYSMSRFRAEDRCRVISLPHLSTFKLFSREECRKPLSEIFEL